MSKSSNATNPKQVTAIREEGVRLDRKYTVDFSYCDGQLLMKWSPDVPTGKKQRKLMPAYLTARNRFLTKVSQLTGGTVVAINPDGSISAITEEGVL